MAILTLRFSAGSAGSSAAIVF